MNKVYICMACGDYYDDAPILVAASLERSKVEEFMATAQAEVAESTKIRDAYAVWDKAYRDAHPQPLVYSNKWFEALLAAQAEYAERIGIPFAQVVCGKNYSPGTTFSIEEMDLIP